MCLAAFPPTNADDTETANADEEAVGGLLRIQFDF